MVEKTLKEIKKYAEVNKVPIMQDDGIKFLTNFIKENNIKKVLEDNKNELALCVDNCAAIEFTDQFISVIKSSKKAKAYKAYYKDRLYLEDIN